MLGSGSREATERRSSLTRPLPPENGFSALSFTVLSFLSSLSNKQINPCCKGTSTLKIIRSSLGFYGEAISVYYTYSCSIFIMASNTEWGGLPIGVLLGTGKCGCCASFFSLSLVIRLDLSVCMRLLSWNVEPFDEYHHCNIFAALKSC